MIRNRTSMIRLLAVAVLAPALFAFQWTNQKKSQPRDPNVRNVQGVVKLANDTVVEGAVVKLKNMKTLQIRSFITQADGKYYFYGLSTGVDYELKGEYKEMASATRQLTVFDSRLDVTMNLTLEAAKK